MLTNVIALLLRRPKKDPNTIDLRYFRTMVLSDSWDGVITCSDGWTRTILFYNGREVHCHSVLKSYGSTEIRHKEGDDDGFYQMMNNIARQYFIVVRKAREAIGVDPKNPKIPDHILLGAEEFKILTNHPQYKEMQMNFLTTGHKVWLEKSRDPDYYVISVEPMV